MTVDLAHDQARTLSSAWFDGEIGPADLADLRNHLIGCDACTTYTESIRELSTLTGELPRVGPGPSLATVTVDLVKARHLTPAATSATRSRRWRVMPLALAAAVIAVVVGISSRPGDLLVPLPGNPFAPLPASAETAALQRITSVYVEREIVETPAGDLAQRRRIAEKVWWRSPDLLRIERTIVDASGRRSDELVVRRGTERFDAADGRRVTTRRGPPDLDVLPEPLSATVALLGQAIGPGPDVAGRPTTTYELRIEGARRLAYVDNSRFLALGGEDRFVLSKEQLVNGVPVATRAVRRIDINVAIEDHRFVLPESDEVRNLGFVERPSAELDISPPARPQGLDVVRAVSAGSSEAMLFQRGAFPVLVTTGAPNTLTGPVEVQTTTVRGRAAVLRIPLYDVPSITFTFERRPITVTAPLRPADLVELVAQMYFPAE